VTAFAPSLPFPRPRLVGAEILKLRKRRGLVVTTGLLTVGASLLVFAILVALHEANPAKHGPAGGITNLGNSLWLLSTLGSVVGILVGGTAGAGDLGAGVFKELVVTGRSRRALFAARIPGGLAVLFSFVGVGYAVAAVSTVVFAGSSAAPSVSLLVKGGLWLLLSAGFWFAVALGLSSLLGSRTTPIAVLLPFNLALSTLLAGLTFLGAGRDALPIAGLDRLLPQAVADSAGLGKHGPAMSATTAMLVLAVWVCVTLAVGLWRTTTRDA
jgi:ABC-type transport system involved in multi-copper enzyme maturation permease subunit